VSYSVIYNLTLYEYYTVEGTTHCGIPSESNMLREPSNPNVHCTGTRPEEFKYSGIPQGHSSAPV
jgi:hypothetical protein